MAKEVFFIKGSELKEKAFCMYLNSRGNITKKEIAEHLGVSVRTVFNWSKRDSWDNMLELLSERGTSKQGELTGSPVLELLPKQTAQIMSVIEQSSAVEILWQNILLQYAAIIRAQQLMYVEGENILSIEKRHIEENENSASEWENITPWDRYKAFLETQSKAMNVLTNMLNRFEDYKRKGLVNEELSAKIDIIRHKANELTMENGVINVISEIPRK